MVRISDIIGKREEPQEPKRPRPEQPEKLKLPPSIIPKPAPAKSGPTPGAKPEPSAISLSQVSKKPGLLNPEQTKAVYQDMLSLAAQVIQKARAKQKNLDINKINQDLERLSGQIIAENNHLLLESYFSSKQDYLASHMVNSCIYAIKLAVSLGYRDLRLKQLAQAAFLYDIGMVEVYDLANKPAKLSDSEFENMKQHTELGAKFLKDISNLSEEASIVSLQHHERFDGTGYPKGIKGEEISEFARLVAIGDVYEALTHQRQYREILPKFEAVEELIRNKTLFDPKILKAFIDSIGIYPVGTLVQLNNQEIARVLSVNKQSILRPLVSIVSDSQGQPVKGSKLLELTQQTNLYIKKPIDDREIKS